MLRFDMSEYQSKADITRFIGSPDGKIAGALTENVIAQPYSLILLDEFEKAHPDILNLFLQVFDEGHLTDSLGRVADFSNTIIVATSNAESVFIQEQVREGKSVSDFSDALKKKLSSHFRPELLNRFSDVVVFGSLSQEDIVAIARLKLNGLKETLYKSQNVIIEFDDAAVKRIGELGYDPAFGARPIDRAIDDNLKSVLAKQILSGDIIKGEKVQVSVDQNGVFLFSEV
jgi:ATP-dependent Clp protease ATP-binding subunit ClpA